MAKNNQSNIQQDEYVYERKPLKTLQNVKAYNRARDRKSKRLYEEYLEEEESADHEVTPSVF